MKHVPEYLQVQFCNTYCSIFSNLKSSLQLEIAEQMKEISLWIFKCCKFYSMAKKTNNSVWQYFYFKIIVRVDRTCLTNETDINLEYIILKVFHSAHNSSYLKKHLKLNLDKLHILIWSHGLSFLDVFSAVPAIDLLSLMYKFPLFTCSVKINHPF